MIYWKIDKRINLILAYRQLEKKEKKLITNYRKEMEIRVIFPNAGPLQI